MSEAECYTNQKYYLFIFCGVKMLYNCCIVDFGILCLFINDDLEIPLRSQCPETNVVRERELINVLVRARPQNQAACLR
jgi:hypothetical protein